MTAFRIVSASLIALCAFGALADDPPKVAVQFVIEAPRYLSKLPKNGAADAVKRVQDALAPVVRDELQKPFKFLQWVTGETTPSFLKVRLISKPASADVEYRLVLQGVVNGVEVASPPDPLLFPWFESPVTDDADLAIINLKSRIQTVLRDSGVQESVRVHFTSHVPLAHVVTVKTNDKQIIVPLASAKVNSSQLSLLRIKFDSNGKQGEMMVKPSLFTDGSISCSMVHLTFPPIDDDGWQAATPSTLTNVAVMMLKYVFEPYVGARNNGTVSTP